MKRLLFFSVLLFVLVGCSGENTAKGIAEDYMDAVKLGNEYDQMEAREGFIDVFDYEYLQTLEVPEEQDTRNYDYDFWEDYYSDEYSTYTDYKNYYKDLYDDYEIIHEDDRNLELWDGKSYKEIHRFLYNVEIANELGEKLYKKAEITVEPGLYWNGEEHLEDYVITDINLR